MNYNIDFKMLGLTLSGGAKRDDMKAKLKELLEKEDINAAQKVQLETEWNNKIDILFQRDTNNNGVLEEDELVGYDFDGTGVPTGALGNDNVQETENNENAENNGNVNNNGNANNNGNVETTPATETQEMPSLPNKKVTKEEFLEYFKNELPKEWKEKLEGIKPEILYEHLNKLANDNGRVNLSDIEKLSTEDIAKLKKDSEAAEEVPETPEVPDAPPVGGVGGGGGGGDKKIDDTDKTGLDDPAAAADATKTLSNPLDVGDAKTPAEKIEKLEENRDKARTEAEGEIAAKEGEIMDALANDQGISPEKLQEFEAAKAEIDADIALQTGQLAETQNNLSTTQQQKTDAETKSAAKKQEAADCKAKASDLRGKAEAIQIPSPKYDLETGACTNSGEIAAAKAEKARLRAEAAKQDAQAAKAEAEAADLDAQATELGTQITQLETQISQLEAKKDELLQKLLAEASDDTKKKVAELQKEISETRGKLQDALSKIEGEITNQTQEKAREELEAEQKAREQAQEQTDLAKALSISGLEGQEPKSITEENGVITQTFEDGTIVRTMFEDTVNEKGEPDVISKGFEIIRGDDNEKFDELGRLKESEKTEGDKTTTVSLSYNDVDNEDGTKTFATTPETKTTIEKEGDKITTVTEKFDEQGRVIEKQTKTQENKDVEEQVSTTETKYGEGNSKTETTTAGTGKDKTQEVVEYDKNGQEVSKTVLSDFYDDGKNPQSKITTTKVNGEEKTEKTGIAYNSDGTKTETTTVTENGVETIVAKTFDDQGRMTSEETRDAGGLLISRTTVDEFYDDGKPKNTTTEDKNGEKTTTEIEWSGYGDARTEKTKNADGSTTEVTFNAKGKPTSEIVKNGDTVVSKKSIAYSQDDQGKEINTTKELVYENGKPVKNARTMTDADGKETKITREYEYEGDKIKKVTFTVPDEEGKEIKITSEFVYKDGKLTEAKEIMVDSAGKTMETSTTTIAYDSAQEGKRTVTLIVLDENNKQVFSSVALWTGKGLEREDTQTGPNPEDPSKEISFVVKYDEKGNEIA